MACCQSPLIFTRSGFGPVRFFAGFAFFIGEPLAFGCQDSRTRAVAIIHIAMVVPEFKLTQVAVQVLLADGMIDAVQAALHSREKPLNSIAMHVTACVFAPWATPCPAHC